MGCIDQVHYHRGLGVHMVTRKFAVDVVVDIDDDVVLWMYCLAKYNLF